VEYTFDSDGLRLAGHLCVPERVGRDGTNGLVICHGFPSPSNGRLDAARSYFDLADRISDQLGWIVLAFTYRGCGSSEGDFSLAGWLRDTLNAAQELRSRVDVTSVWVAGFGTGGAMAISAAAADPDIAGVAAVGPPADFDDWVRDPEGLLGYARRVGAIGSPGFPADEAAWQAELASIRAVEAAGAMGERPLLVMHGASDEVVPLFDARVIADAHGAADLRVIEGGGHRLRFDPRAVAVLLGWLDRVSRSGPDVFTLDLAGA
jgi:pimeloyl-ACP methyl ester carboxylesterase